MVSHHFGLTVKINKTKVLTQPVPNTILSDVDITISNTPPPEQVKHFPYLSSLISNMCKSEKNVKYRIGAVHATFVKLIKDVLNNENLNNKNYGL